MIKEIYPEPFKQVLIAFFIVIGLLLIISIIIVILATIFNVIRAHYFRENLKPGDIVRIDEGCNEGVYAVKHIARKKVNGITKVYLVNLDENYQIGDHYRQSADLTCDINCIKPY